MPELYVSHDTWMILVGSSFGIVEAFVAVVDPVLVELLAEVDLVGVELAEIIWVLDIVAEIALVVDQLQQLTC